ncbi:hypothetical protein ATANTOWER_015923 [Ataeniobius toweri]|uniref:Uncharacterized protein n=1 Tax=Ataeniobius toweri TaxID=208326 RepID=A0ABU7CHC0_9TELE|nr:hypothetical protein [Ataeniobius toweri]
MPLVGSPMASRLRVTGQTKSGSRHLHEDHTIEASDVAWYGRAGVPPWSQAWGRNSLESAWWPGCSSQDLAGPSPKESREAIPSVPTSCRGNHEGSVQMCKYAHRHRRSPLWRSPKRQFTPGPSTCLLHYPKSYTERLEQGSFKSNRGTKQSGSLVDVFVQEQVETELYNPGEDSGKT